MNLVDAVIADLEPEEQFRGFVYDDATGEPLVPGYKLIGHPTMWWGLCVEKGRIPELPERIPREVLEHVVRRRVTRLHERLPFLAELPLNVQRGVCQMAYQLGVAGVIGFTDMIGALAVGDFTAAKAHALDSDWAHKPPPIGTPARAKRVAALIGNETARVD